MAFQALAERWDRGVGEAMGDQPDDLYTNSTGGAEPAGWADLASQPASPSDAPPPYMPDASPAYGSASSAPSYEVPTPASNSGAGDAYSASDGAYSGWPAANEAEHSATPAAVLDDPWTRSP